MISVPADITGQSKHAADWLDGRKEQGPSPVLARAKRQMEELEVDWADAFAVPETESVTVPRQKKKRTEQPAATSHLPPAISASHTAKPPHPPGKVLAQKTADQQLMAQAAQRVQRQAEQAKKKEDEAKKKKKEEEEKRKKKEKEEEEKRKKKEKEEEEKRKRKEKEEEEKRRKKAEEEKAEKVMQSALSVSLQVLCILGCSVLGRGAEPPEFWVLSIWLEPGISHVTWVHYDATMCLACFACSILPVLHFLRFDLFVL